MKIRTYATHIATAVATASVVAATAAIATPSSDAPSDPATTSAIDEIDDRKLAFDAQCSGLMDGISAAGLGFTHVTTATAEAQPGPGTAAVIEEFEGLESGGSVSIDEDGLVVIEGDIERLDGSSIDLLGDVQVGRVGDGPLSDAGWEAHLETLADEAGVEVGDVQACFDLLDELAELEMERYRAER